MKELTVKLSDKVYKVMVKHGNDTVEKYGFMGKVFDLQFSIVLYDDAVGLYERRSGRLLRYFEVEPFEFDTKKELLEMLNEYITFVFFDLDVMPDEYFFNELLSLYWLYRPVGEAVVIDTIDNFIGEG